jgi:hypothetical protein
MSDEFRRIWFANELWRIPRELARAEDERWFAAHPDEGERWRALVPGEADNDSGGLCYPPEFYLVRASRSGLREFVPLDRGSLPEPVAPAYLGADSDNPDDDPEEER